MPLYYGLAYAAQVREFARRVCDVIGHGAHGTAVDLLVETCAQETHGGRLRDRHPLKHGVGLYQFDPIGFKHVQQNTHPRNREKVRGAFGVDIQTVKYEQLADDPLLSTIFARLFYYLIPHDLPATQLGRAQLWKQYYNTVKGKGTVAEYLKNAQVYVR